MKAFTEASMEFPMEPSTASVEASMAFVEAFMEAMIALEAVEASMAASMTFYAKNKY